MNSATPATNYYFHTKLRWYEMYFLGRQGLLTKLGLANFTCDIIKTFHYDSILPEDSITMYDRSTTNVTIVFYNKEDLLLYTLMYGDMCL